MLKLSNKCSMVPVVSLYYVIGRVSDQLLTNSDNRMRRCRFTTPIRPKPNMNIYQVQVPTFIKTMHVYMLVRTHVSARKPYIAICRGWRAFAK